MILLFALTLGCGAKKVDLETGSPPPDRYENSVPKLATAYAAVLGCSCHFVSERSAEDCELYLKISPDIAKIKVDDEAKRVTSRALGGFESTAIWVNEREGCILE